MNRVIITVAVLVILVDLIIVSGGVLVWLSVIADGELNRPQEALLTAADWMIKACAGAVFMVRSTSSTRYSHRQPPRGHPPPGGTAVTYSGGGVITDEELLPGFSLPLSEIFE